MERDISLNCLRPISLAGERSFETFVCATACQDAAGSFPWLYSASLALITISTRLVTEKRCLSVVNGNGIARASNKHCLNSKTQPAY